MRTITVLVVVLTLLCGVAFVYAYQGAQVQAVAPASTMTAAKDAPATYREITTALAEGTFTGRVLQSSDFIMPDGYSFLTITVRLSNKGLFDQSWVTLQAIPDPADIVEIAQLSPPTIAPGTTADVTVTLLTRAGVSDRRALTVTYYVMGLPMAVQIPIL